MVGWVVSRNASSPSLSGNRRCQDGLGVSTLEPNCPSVFPLILLLPSRSYFLREEISLARLFLILVATYFQKHANRKLHNIAHKIGSHITKSPILDWLPLLTKSTIYLKLAALIRKQWATDQSMGNSMKFWIWKGSAGPLRGHGMNTGRQTCIPNISCHRPFSLQPTLWFAHKFPLRRDRGERKGGIFSFGILKDMW